MGRLYIALSLLLFTICSSYHSIAQQAGTIDLSFDPGIGPNGSVYETTTQSDGKILIGGAFTQVLGVQRNRIARLNSDGTLDATFNSGAGADDVVRTIIEQPDGKILISGSFTNYDGIARGRIARLNHDGSLDLTFNPTISPFSSGFTDPVHDMKLFPDGKIIAVGAFFRFNNTIVRYIARLNPDATLDPTFVTPTNLFAPIYTIEVLPNGKLIIGGAFGAFNGVPAMAIARLQPNGAFDASFNSGIYSNGPASGVTRVVVLPNSQLLVTAMLTLSATGPAYHILRLNANGSLDLSFSTGSGANFQISDMEVQTDTKIIITGFFTSFNSTAQHGILRLFSNGTIDPSFNPGTGLQANGAGGRSLELYPDGRLLIAGTFASYNGITRNNIARVLLGGGTITTNSISTVNVCQGETISVSYTANGTFSPGNYFTAELSDASGSFSNPVIIGTLTSTNSIDTISATIPITFPTGSNYRIRVMPSNPFFQVSDNGSNLTINPTPVLSTAASATAVCLGGSITLAVSGALTYNWQAGNGLTAQSGNTVVVTPTASGSHTYTVTGTNSFGCTGSKTISIFVNNPPLVSVTTNSSSICAGQNITLTAAGAASYSWSTGQTSNSIIVSPTSATTYTVTGTNSQGCTDTASVTITVKPAPQVPVITSNPTICAGDTLALQAIAIPGVNYSWTGPASFTSTLQNPVINNVSSANSGTYTLTILAANGCSSQATHSVVVGALPTSVFVSNINGNSVTFTAYGPGAYNWSFPGGSPATATTKSVTVTYSSPGSFTASLTITNTSSCSATSTQTISILGTEELLFSSASLYPNPSTGLYTFTLAEPVEAEVMLQVYNSIGKLVKKVTMQRGTTQSVIDLSEAASGTYLLKLQSAKSVQTRYLLKN